MSDYGKKPLPKFGDWDVSNPASAEGFTVIFNKARNERKTGVVPDTSEPTKTNSMSKKGSESNKSQSPAKKWFCCTQPATAE